MNVRTYYVLTWQSPPRLPAHPRIMVGKQGFETIEKALNFFKKQAPDNLFINLEKVTEVSEDFSEIFIQLGAK